jgi:hypothetical protein
MPIITSTTPINPISNLRPIPIATTVVSNINDNIDGPKPGCNCAFCSCKRNKLDPPKIIPITASTTSINPIPNIISI